MTRLAILAVLTAGAAGCRPAAEVPAPSAEPTAQTAPSEPGGIAPMTPTPLPNAPVAGGESLQGGGSAVGQVAKDRARSLGGGSSIDQMPNDDQ